MTSTSSIRRPFARLAVTAALAAAFLAAGYSNHHASASVPPAGQGPVQAPAAKPAAPAPDFVHGKITTFATNYEPGSIVIISKSRLLFYVLDDGKAVEYRIATGKPGFEWAGIHRVSAKVRWPSWNPPIEMRKRRPELPEFMAGGPENPLGARAI